VPDVGLAQEELRVGSRVLSLFANPLNVRVLRAHVDGPKRFADLKFAVGWSAESTLRAVTKDLCEVGALKREMSASPRGAVATALTAAGEELLFVADILQAWLTRFPSGPIALDGEEAKSAVKALAGGWSSTLIRELATAPVTLSELNGRILEISYPSLERRLNWMRMTGQIEAVPSEGRGIPYAPTEWLRRAIGPVAASGRCERRHMEVGSPPVTDSEVEAAMLLVLPLAPLPEHASGRCLLAAPTDPAGGEEGDGHLAGVTVLVERGRLVDCVPGIAAEPPSWAIGSPDGWLDAVLNGQLENMRLGGADLQLALDLVAGLHMALTIDR
jgi:DNA-binding HxlR family transcriptional regulator